MRARKVKYGNYAFWLLAEAQENPNECFYCKDPATCEDHTPPIWWLNDCEPENIPYRYLYVVPSCTNCNSILGGKILLRFQERRAYVAERLYHKYGSLLYTRPWTEEEMKDLGRTLGDYISSRQAIREHVQRRLFWLELDQEAESDD